MKVFFIHDPSDWHPKHALELFRRQTSLKPVTDYQNADLIWIFNEGNFFRSRRFFGLTPIIPLGKLKHKLIVTSINHELFARKKYQWQKPLLILDRITDYYHAPSRKIFRQLKPLVSKPVKILPYWIDLSLFYPLEDKLTLRKKFPLPADKIIIGSFQRDTESHDLKSPKLEKGPDILLKICRQLKKEIFVLLAGPNRQYLIKRFQKHQIPFLYLGQIDYYEMNFYYNLVDWYLVTSRYEAGPQAVFEAAATKTKILSTSVGSAADILHLNCLCRDPDEFVRKFHQEIDETEFNFRKVQDFRLEKIIPQYDQFFKSLLKK